MKRTLSLLGIFALPALVFAQTHAVSNIQTAYYFVLGLINFILVPIIFAVAFLFFIFGVYRYFIAGRGSEEKVAEGQKFVMWSIIGFVLMFSVWGLVNVLINTLGFGGNAMPNVPVFNSGSASSNSNGTYGGSGTSGTYGGSGTSGTYGGSGTPGTSNTAPAMTDCGNGVQVPVGQVCQTQIICSGDPAPAGSTCCAGGGYAQPPAQCPNVPDTATTGS